MKRTVYIFSHGHITRKDNNLWLHRLDGSKEAIPVEAVDSLLVFGELSLNKRLLQFLNAHGIPIHFFNRNGYYSGSYWPRNRYNSGFMVLRQAEHYLDEQRRLYLAKAFATGSLNNMLRNLSYYQRRGTELSSESELIADFLQEMMSAPSIEDLMGLEGMARKAYYASFNKILGTGPFSFSGRHKQPPDNPLNATISFGNSLLYVAALSEIYHTQLDPRIGYLHSTNERSFTLNLDIADVFKPVIVDRVIFSLANRRQLHEEHFEERMGGILLTEKGRKAFVEEFEGKMRSTIQHRRLQRKVSYRYMLRLECYKLYRHFIGESPYIPYVSEW
jgi:CRISPR-associated protein Cas1